MRNISLTHLCPTFGLVFFLKASLRIYVKVHFVRKTHSNLAATIYISLILKFLLQEEFTRKIKTHFGRDEEFTSAVRYVQNKVCH